jgi:hypothetical protein
MLLWAIFSEAGRAVNDPTARLFVMQERASSCTKHFDTLLGTGLIRVPAAPRTL